MICLYTAPGHAQVGDNNTFIFIINVNKLLIILFNDDKFLHRAGARTVEE